MAKLILSRDGSVMREVPLDKERLTIGRKPHNDIRIENPVVGDEHARIVTILENSFLEDLDSAAGTLVNGRPARKHVLQNNDVVEIGDHCFQYVAGTPPADIPLQAHAAACAPAAAPAAALRILNGPSAGTERQLVKNLTTLGKRGVQVAVITRRPRGYFVTHIEGVSFPAVNGRTLDDQAHALEDHDVIELSGVKVEFLIKPK
ncbi:MAG: FHA domain-containing protein [Burkholderiales bacterium]